MARQTEQDMQDLTIYDDLITSLTTLKVILEDIDRITIVINNKIKQLEAENFYELKLLEEELNIITLRSRFLRRPNNFVEEEEIDLRRQTKKKMDNTENI